MTTLVFGNEAAPDVLIQPVDSHDLGFIEDEVKEIRRLAGEDFCLLAVRTDDWNRDLSPWQAPAVFGTEGFGGRADRTLEEILKLCGNEGRRYFIGGYSLAGLFALWAAVRTDRFAGVAAASPSVWFPGFVEYLREHDIQCPSVYLSLGDREEKTRNPVMAAVGAGIVCWNGIREIISRIRTCGPPKPLPGSFSRNNRQKNPAGSPQNRRDSL